jgi:VanZ family protein
VRKKHISLITWTLVIILMATIFFLSAQTASESTKLSDQTIRDVAVIVVPKFSKMPQEKQKIFVLDLRHTARKTAHVLMYMLLGILCMSAMFQLSMKIKMKILIAIIISTGYAATDELHQHFVNGRSPQISDVIIDFCGVLVGIMLVLLAHWIWSLQKRRFKPNAISNYK